jgi:probable phosphoglycerate mutase
MANKLATGLSIFDFTGDGKKTPPPSWASKIARTLKRRFVGADMDLPPDTTKPNLDAVTSLVDNHSNFTSLPNAWRVFSERKATILDIDRMDVEDEYVSAALDIIADFCVRYTENGEPDIHIKATNATDQKIIDDLMERTGTLHDAWQTFRDMVKYGFAPREVLLNRDTNEIAATKQTISYQIFPKCTEKGDKVPGWMVMTDKDIYNGVGGTELEDWQILPFSYGAKRGFLSVPILASARRNWQRLSKIEDGMAVARLTRAYDKLVHRVPVKAEWTPEQIVGALQRYKDKITKRKIQSNEGFVTQNENPLDVQTDFFLPDIGDGRGGVETLNSTNLQLGNLNDVYYAREKLIARLRVPIAFLQITSAQKTHLKSGGQVSDVDIQFGMMIRALHANYRRNLKRLIDLQLLLKVRNPMGAYKIDLPDVPTDNPSEQAKIQLTLAQAAAYFVEAFGALPPALIASKWLDLDDEQQALMDKFLSANGDKIMKARMAAMQPPPKTPSLNPASAGGSGGATKSVTKGGKGTPPSKATRPSKKQSITLGTATKKAKKHVLYVGRHGKTKLNNVSDKSEDRIRGWLDVPLVAEGKKEAKAEGKKLKGKGITKIYASDLNRTKDTADIIGEIIGCDDIMYVKWLRPWNLGDFQGKPSQDFVKKIKHYLENPDEEVPGGESYNDFISRFFGGAERVMESLADDEDGNILFVTHYRNIKTLEAWCANGCPDDHSVDEDTFMKDTNPPGSIISFVVSNPDDEEQSDDGEEETLVQRSMLERVPPPADAWAEDAPAVIEQDDEPVEEEEKVPIEQAVKLFMRLHLLANQSLQQAGLNVPDIEQGFEDVVRKNLQDLAIDE